ncbi:hypothetical protein HMN09_00835300 [Mycena chlorophos]|uniref:F-box domain-containing protein n=1 Tax=Mycena chlorophos TaxID=658473 RepID=A0A8H6SSM0_MYCCL|nr:hypothetical protein HMN09_00835300 [Mycena chlorophos]
MVAIERLFVSNLLPNEAENAEISRFLRSNTTPTEPTALRSTIESSKVDLEAYDTDISALEVALEKAKRQRAALETHVGRCQSIFSPIRTLPTELLLRIFSLCSQELESTFSHDFTSWSHLTPQDHMKQLARIDLLRPSRVCYLWRTTILNTPSLWTAIQVNLTEWVLPSHARKLTPLLEAAVARSGNSPLHLKLRSTAQAYELPGLEFLANTAPRWRALTIWMSSTTSKRLNSLGITLPLLTRLEIHGELLSEVTVFADAPHLQEVTLRRSGSKQPPKLPWSQLRVLNYEDGTAAELAAFMKLVAISENLEAVSIMNLDVSVQPVGLYRVFCEIQSFSITLRNSRDHVSIHATTFLESLLHPLMLSHLRDLRIRMKSRRPLRWSGLGPPFENLLRRSFCADNIACLALHGVIITSSQLFGLFINVPLLEKLYLADLPRDLDIPEKHDLDKDFVVLTDDILCMLSGKASDLPPNGLLPRLRVLCCTTLFQFSADAMREFMVARQPGRTAALEDERRKLDLHLLWHPSRPWTDPHQKTGLETLQVEAHGLENIRFSVGPYREEIFESGNFD